MFTSEGKAECEAKIRDIASKLDKLSAQWEKLITASRPGPTYVPREEKILLDKLSYFDEKFDLEAIKTRLGLKRIPPFFFFISRFLYRT
jgi:hypothetical protein